jgi:hypothetical protein
MTERRKTRDRRVNAPRNDLPPYYARSIADRRRSVACMQRIRGSEAASVATHKEVKLVRRGT